jgi:hypothetical protein
MPYQERNIVVAIFTNLVIVIYFALRIYGMFQDGQFDGAGGLMLWARTILWMIPVSIVATIIATILFNIFYAILTNQPKPSFVVDERDRAIEITGMKVTVVVISAGFMAAMVALAFGWTAFIVFNVILFSFAMADLGGNLVKLTMYRFGL